MYDINQIHWVDITYEKEYAEVSAYIKKSLT